jgi:hypothetical protein
MSSVRSIYQDKYSLWHDKPCVNGEPKSNNWATYSLYAHILGLPLDRTKMGNYFDRCVVNLDRSNITIYRHPGKKEPPYSADEVIGAYGLSLIPYDTLKGNYFVFQGKGKPLSSQTLIDCLKGMFELAVHININIFLSKKKKLKMRNIFWERKVTKLYQVAYRLHPAYVRAIKHIEGISAHREEREIFNFYAKMVKDGDDYSQKNLLWALYTMMGKHKDAKKLDPINNFERYFSKEHDLAKAMRIYYTNR